MSDTPTPSTRKTARFPWLLLVCIITALSILAGLTIPCFSRTAQKGVLTMQLSNLKQVSLALRMYRDDSESAAKSLSEVAMTGRYVSKEAWAKLGKFTVGNPPKSLDWLYFPERLRDDDDDPVVILASPEPFDGFRLVGWSDSTCQMISEEKFAAIQGRGGKGKSSPLKSR